MPGAQIWIWSSTTNKRLASSSAGWLQQKSQGRNTVRSIRNKPLTFDKSHLRIAFLFVNWPKNVKKKYKENLIMPTSAGVGV